MTLPSSNCSLSCSAYPSPHHHAADDLTLDHCGIQGRTDIVGRGDFSDFDHAGLFINLHLDGLGRILPSGNIFFALSLVR